MKTLQTHPGIAEPSRRCADLLDFPSACAGFGAACAARCRTVLVTLLTAMTLLSVRLIAAPRRRVDALDRSMTTLWGPQRPRRITT